MVRSLRGRRTRTYPDLLRKGDSPAQGHTDLTNLKHPRPRQAKDGTGPFPELPLAMPGPADDSLPVFRVRGLTKTYTTGEVAVQALRGLDLDIRRGEFLVLLGASGSGKSTLLNILGGLETATSGGVDYLDHDLTRASEDELTRYRREHVGFVFQFYNLIPSLTAAENVALVTDIVAHPMPVAEALERVGLSHRASHFPSQLSGGEQQRVAIARAIVKRPDVLLCDEPTGALDYATGKLVLECIARINTELGTTAVVITHNAAIAAMADRVVHLGDGRIQRVDSNAHKVSPSELSW
jgi:putative ABC transport system ATP-binding protein